MTTVDISLNAQEYLKKLLDNQPDDDMSVRIYVNNPGHATAETCLAYCKKDEQKPDDSHIDDLLIKVWLENRSLPYLEDCKVDYNPDELGGQLTIKAPNAKIPLDADKSEIAYKVRAVLVNEINPSLASHGGFIQLIEMVENDTVAILQFGGGCQGCGMVDVTLKEGVEKTLLEQVPELKAIRDSTDHSDTTAAYY